MNRTALYGIATALALLATSGFAQTPAPGKATAPPTPVPTAPAPTQAAPVPPAANQNKAAAPAASATPGPVCPAGKVADPKGACVPLIDINAASAADIKTHLAGFGAVFSQKVVDERDKRGVFLGEADFKKRMSAAGVAAANIDSALPQVMTLPVLDANTASATQMKAVLPGIGEALASRIVDARAKGPFLSKQDLKDRATAAGVPAPTIEAVLPVMALADLNKASADQLKAILPSIGDTYSKRIADPANRPYKSPDELVTKGILPQAVFDRIEEFVIAGR